MLNAILNIALSVVGFWLGWELSQARKENLILRHILDTYRRKTGGIPEDKPGKSGRK